MPRFQARPAPIDVDGDRENRQYLLPQEREAFIQATELLPPQQRTLCLTLALTGCRISEALQMTADHVDLAAKCLLFGRSRKLEGGSIREVPVSQTLLDVLENVHGLRYLQRVRSGGNVKRLWPIARMTAWRWVTQVMESVGIEKSRALPSALRNGFCVQALSRGIPADVIQRWTGFSTPLMQDVFEDFKHMEV